MNKEELKEYLFQYLTNYPEDSPEFLDTISSALKNYKRKLTIQRSNEAFNAIGNLFGYIKTNKKTMTTKTMHYELMKIIDAMYVRFPKGSSKGGSSLDLEVFEYFQFLTKSIEDVTEFVVFLESTRGREFAEWFKIVLKGVNE